MGADDHHPSLSREVQRKYHIKGSKLSLGPRTHRGYTGLGFRDGPAFVFPSLG